MPRLKKGFKPPPSLWVVFDLETKHVVSAYTSQEMATFEVSEELNPEYEVVVHYELKKG